MSRIALNGNGRPVPLRIATYYSTNVATGFFIALVFLDRKLLRMRQPPLQVRGRQTEIGFEQHIHHLQLKLSARRAGEHGTGGPIPLPSIESRMEQPER